MEAPVSLSGEFGILVNLFGLKYGVLIDPLTLESKSKAVDSFAFFNDILLNSIVCYFLIIVIVCESW